MKKNMFKYDFKHLKNPILKKNDEIRKKVDKKKKLLNKQKQFNENISKKSSYDFKDIKSPFEKSKEL